MLRVRYTVNRHTGWCV